MSDRLVADPVVSQLAALAITPVVTNQILGFAPHESACFDDRTGDISVPLTGQDLYTNVFHGPVCLGLRPAVGLAQSVVYRAWPRVAGHLTQDQGAGVGLDRVGIRRRAVRTGDREALVVASDAAGQRLSEGAS